MVKMFVAAESSRWSIGREPIEAVRRGLHFLLAIHIVAFASEARLKWILASLIKRRWKSGPTFPIHRGEPLRSVVLSP